MAAPRKEYDGLKSTTNERVYVTEKLF